MYQALYRKWRPRTFDDVVGQEHITTTLKRQVAAGRTSHAYLFTGTRGTGKTSCAKLLARAVNCEHPVDGSPCNRCPSCTGIENGSILDVVELDAASNNRVDDVRAILDEAVYTPVSVKKRVYIVDEVHMLSGQAFNALLQTLEEPPEHVMFILATTELHKVPATIKSRCQQFAFKRIRPDAIAGRLSWVAEQEGFTLTPEGAALLARLADGGMRDALSLLDRCAGEHRTLGEPEIIETLGLAGNTEAVGLLECAAKGDTEGALTRLDRLYAGGKEMSALLGELSGLARDLLVRRAAPKSGGALLTGGCDSAVLDRLGRLLDTPRLLRMTATLQQTVAGLMRSPNRRIDTELCLVSLCDPRMDDSPAGLAARVAALEEQAARGGVESLSRRPMAGETPSHRPMAGDSPLFKGAKGQAQPQPPLKGGQRASVPPAPLEKGGGSAGGADGGFSDYDAPPFPDDGDAPPPPEDAPPERQSSVTGFQPATAPFEKGALRPAENVLAEKKPPFSKGGVTAQAVTGDCRMPRPPVPAYDAPPPPEDAPPERQSSVTGFQPATAPFEKGALRPAENVPAEKKPPFSKGGGHTEGVAGGSCLSWAALRSRLEQVMNIADFCFVGNGDMVSGTVEGGMVTLWAHTEFVKGFIDKPDILKLVADTAGELAGTPFHAQVRVGQPPAAAPVSGDPLDALSGLANVTEL